MDMIIISGNLIMFMVREYVSFNSSSETDMTFKISPVGTRPPSLIKNTLEMNIHFYE